MNGIEIKIDDLGRLVIPIKYRRKLDLACGDKLLISLNEEGLILTPLEKRCGLCKTKLQGNEKIELCNICISKVKALQE